MSNPVEDYFFLTSANNDNIRVKLILKVISLENVITNIFCHLNGLAKLQG